MPLTTKISKKLLELYDDQRIYMYFPFTELLSTNQTVKKIKKKKRKKKKSSRHLQLSLSNIAQMKSGGH